MSASDPSLGGAGSSGSWWSSGAGLYRAVLGFALAFWITASLAGLAALSVVWRELGTNDAGVPHWKPCALMVAALATALIMTWRALSDADQAQIAGIIEDLRGCRRPSLAKPAGDTAPHLETATVAVAVASGASCLAHVPLMLAWDDRAEWALQALHRVSLWGGLALSVPAVVIFAAVWRRLKGKRARRAYAELVASAVLVVGISFTPGDAAGWWIQVGGDTLYLCGAALCYLAVAWIRP